MRRREFIALLCGAASLWPLAVGAQKPPLPVIGFLSNASADLYTVRLRAFHKGLKDEEYVVAVDPIKIGLVASLNRPGGNLTGIANLNVEVGPKRLELLRELIPTATIIALLVNPTSPSIAEGFLRALQPAARALGLQLHVLNASTDRDFDPVFATMDQLRADALVISPDVFFNTRIERLAMLSLHHAVPAIYQYRPFVAAGGVIGYGSDETEYYRLVGTYTGKILKGEKPADLPVVQSTKVELIINLK